MKIENLKIIKVLEFVYDFRIENIEGEFDIISLMIMLRMLLFSNNIVRFCILLYVY